jgi:hypothetical protein
MLVTMIVAGAALQSAAAETAELRRSPKLKPGQALAITTTGRSQTRVTDAETGKLVRQSSQSLRWRGRQRVVSIDDESGKVESIAQTVETYTRLFSVTAPAEEKFEKAIELTDIRGAASRSGDSFAAEPSSLVSSKHRELSAQQIAAVKSLFSSTMRLEAWPEVDLLLMPAEAVKVGDSWRPDGKQLQRWLEGSGMLGRSGGKVTKADFALLGVSKGVATVRGRMHLGLKLAEELTVEPVLNVVFRIDSETGLWRSKTLMLSGQFKANGAVIELTNERTVFIRNLGVPEMPDTQTAGDDLFKLGWTSPAKNDNRYRDTAGGLSLDVPEDYRAADSERPGVHTFGAEGGGQLVISLGQNERMLELDELAGAVEQNLARSVAGYKRISRRTLYLADHVPAVLISGSCLDGKSMLLTLVAVDGERLVNVTAGADADATDELARLEKVLLSLRLFEPRLGQE